MQPTVRKLVALACASATALQWGFLAPSAMAAPRQATVRAAPPHSCPAPTPTVFQGKIATELSQSTPAASAPVRAPAGAPNILVWMIDDIGFSQLSAFGGPIETPNIDRVAAMGLRYANFHASPICSASRAAFLTGRNPHAVHMGAHALSPLDFPGYDDQVPTSAATIARILHDAGYGTLALGKWDHAPPKELTSAGPFRFWPQGQGFDEYYGFLAADADHFSPALWDGNHLIGEAPKRPNYFLETDLADHAIDFIDGFAGADQDRPFFIYFATGAGHYPHQAPQAWRDRYRGAFDMGWDVAREQALARQKAMGLVPADTQLSARPASVPAWASLSEPERKLFARQMEVFAAYVAEADHEFGRVLDELERTGRLDNTMIIVVSDNGASPEGGRYGTDNEVRALAGRASTLDRALAEEPFWGDEHHGGLYAMGWAMAGNSPFPGFKTSPFEGGVHIPMAIAWTKGIAARGEVRRNYHHMIDLAPTIMAAANIAPSECIGGAPQQRFDGFDMSYSFANSDEPDRRTRQYYEFTGNRSIYEKGWAAVAQRWGALPKPGATAGQDTWSLYDLHSDFSESRDLAHVHPERLALLKGVFDDEARRNSVYPLRDSVQLSRTRPTQRKFDFETGAWLSAEAAPPLAAGAHTIEARVELAAESQGVLVALGGVEGGFSFFVKNHRLHYVYNNFGLGEESLVSARNLPVGTHTLTYRYIPDEPGGTSGVGQLLVDRDKVAEGRIEHLRPFLYSGGDELFAVGRDPGTPVTAEYAAPFNFTGVLGKVGITLDEP